MATVKFIRDDNKEFFIDNRTWKLLKNGLEGFDGVDIETHTQSKAYSAGSFYQGQRVAEKDRTIKALLTDRSLNKVMREEVRKFFVSNHTYTIYINYYGTERKFSGVLYAKKLPAGKIYDFLELTVTILSVNPYLMSVDEFGENIGSRIAKFGFPFPSIVDKGFAFSVLEYKQQTTLKNDGDVPTYPRIVIHSNGDVQFPKVMIGDKYIQYNDVLKENDVLIIDLTGDKFKVTLNDKNVIGKTDRGSSFTDFQIKTGDNIFKYDAQSGANLLDVNVYYNQMYEAL